MPENRCPQCGQPLMMGRCGMCSYREPPPEQVAAATAEPSSGVGVPGAGPAPVGLPYATGPIPEPAPPATRRTPPNDGESKVSPLVVAALVALVVVGMLAAFAVITISSVKSDVSGLRADQAAASDRLTQIEGQLSLASDAESALRSQLDAQRAADPVVIAGQVQPSVFTIETPEGLGSGWVVATDGARSTLITNFHVVADVVADGSNAVKVFHDNDTKLDGIVQQASESADLAVVIVNGQLPVLKISSQKVAAGQAVLVVGSPLGLGGSVTTGTVSALRDDYIQFSAPISPGNSGGPIINLSGEVVGVTEAKAVGLGVEGVGIAIPINRVCGEFKIAC
ncbi:MAG: putative serine protease PepD [Acidimicrobiaceae bacterium]